MRPATFEYRLGDDTGAFWSCVVTGFFVGQLTISTMWAAIIRHEEQQHPRAETAELLRDSFGVVP